MRRSTLIVLTLTAVAALLLTAVAEAERGCVRVRGKGELTQPAGPLTDWVGPGTLKMRGQTYTGQVTVYIDPTLLGNAGPPTFQVMAFDWFTMDFGAAGKLELWELATLTPLDPTGSRVAYDGIAHPGPSYLGPATYGPPSTGIFTGAHGLLFGTGTIRMTFPTEPNSLKYKFKGQLCGLQR